MRSLVLSILVLADCRETSSEVGSEEVEVGMAMMPGAAARRLEMTENFMLNGVRVVESVGREGRENV